MPTHEVYTAKWDYFPKEDKELAFVKGDHVIILNKCTPDWWEGRLESNQSQGIFPSSHVIPTHDTNGSPPHDEEEAQKYDNANFTDLTKNTKIEIGAAQTEDHAILPTKGSPDEHETDLISLPDDDSTMENGSHAIYEVSSENTTSTISSTEVSEGNPYLNKCEKISHILDLELPSTLAADEDIDAGPDAVPSDISLSSFGTSRSLPVPHHSQLISSKEGPLLFRLSSSKSDTNPWKVYHVILTNGVASLYKDIKSQDLAADYEIDLALASLYLRVSDLSLFDSKDCLFVLKLGHSQYIFQAASREEKNSWILAIKHHSEIAKSKTISALDVTSKTKESKLASGFSRFQKWAKSSTKKTSDSPENSPNGDEKVSRTSKFKSLFSSNSHTNVDLIKDDVSYGTVFGGELVEQLKREKSNVPFIMKTCIAEIERRAMKSEGLYRLSGNSLQVQKLKSLFKAGLVDMSVPPWNSEDINVITGVIKLYLRELKNPLMTFELYEEFVAATKLADYHDRLETIKTLVHRLPDPHYTTLAYLMRHLSRVADQVEFNKMGYSGLAIVFGPTLMKSEKDDLSSVVNMGVQNATIEALLTQANWIFDKVTDDVLLEESPSGNSPSDDIEEVCDEEDQNGETIDDHHKDETQEEEEEEKSVLDSAESIGTFHVQEHCENIDLPSDEVEFTLPGHVS